MFSIVTEVAQVKQSGDLHTLGCLSCDNTASPGPPKSGGSFTTPENTHPVGAMSAGFIQLLTDTVQSEQSGIRPYNGVKA